MEENNNEQTNSQPTQEFTAQEATNKTEPIATKRARIKWNSLKKLKVACAALAIGLALSLGGNIALVSSNFNNPADMRHDAKMEQFAFNQNDRGADKAGRPDSSGTPGENMKSDETNESEKPDTSNKPGESDKTKHQSNAAGNEQGSQKQDQTGQSENVEA